MNSFWTWLDGKKTVIGSLMLWVALFLQDTVIAEWNVTAAWIPMVIDTFNWFGTILVPLGIGHKAVKAAPPAP